MAYQASLGQQITDSGASIIRFYFSSIRFFSKFKYVLEKLDINVSKSAVFNQHFLYFIYQDSTNMRYTLFLNQLISIKNNYWNSSVIGCIFDVFGTFFQPIKLNTRKDTLMSYKIKGMDAIWMAPLAFKLRIMDGGYPYRHPRIPRMWQSLCPWPLPLLFCVFTVQVSAGS